MFLLIDNNDGAGELDYSPAVRSDGRVLVTRERGKWTTCSAALDLQGAGLAKPVDRARVRVLDAGGNVVFQGFAAGDGIATEEMARTEGSDESTRMLAVEGAWLTSTAPSSELQPSTATQHVLALSAVKMKSRTAIRIQDLAGDVTVSGGNEAAAYVTELFRGDGTTTTMLLGHAPFREAGSETLLDESFDDATLSTSRWTKVDTGSYLSLGAGGLHMGGGTGYDSSTVLRYAAPVEMGGTLVAEASGVQLQVGSDGLLMGFYNNAVMHDLCVAGVRVKGTAGAHIMLAIVNGVEQAMPYDFEAGHNYTIRVRLHCTEMQRVRNSYGALVDGLLQQFSGDAVDAPLHMVIEVVDTGLASSTLPTVLYQGAMATSPMRCVFAPVNSTQLVGSLGRVKLQQTGSCWVVSTAADGTQTTRREGAPGTGADFALSSSGTLTFDPGRIPQPDELVTATYRRYTRSVWRAQDAGALEMQGNYGLPGIASWTGKVLSPEPRSSADCAAAAKALLALGAGVETGRSGTVSWVRQAVDAGDVLPGDSILLDSSEGERTLTVTKVTLQDEGCEPEVVACEVAFGQSRVENLLFTVSDSLADDVAEPVALSADPASLPVALNGLQVTMATNRALQIDSGVDAPDGCGFEVRRSDANFGSGSTGDLVLQSPVRSFSIPRLQFEERFFIRMYGNTSPRKYSPVSSVVWTHLPVGD